MTKPKPRLKPFKRVMWVIAGENGGLVCRPGRWPMVPFLSATRNEAATLMVAFETPVRVLVTIRPVAGRRKK